MISALKGKKIKQSYVTDNKIKLWVLSIGLSVVFLKGDIKVKF